MQTDHEVTNLLSLARQGQREAADRLIQLVYEELRRVARGMMVKERTDHTWQATELANEAVVRLLDPSVLADMHNRAYFFGAACRAMRQLLVDHARQRQQQKRGGDWNRVPLDDIVEDYESRQIDLLALDDALKELEKLNTRQAEAVHLRFFGGLEVKEVAAQLNVSLATAENDLRIARAWLRSRMRES